MNTSTPSHPEPRTPAKAGIQPVWRRSVIAVSLVASGFAMGAVSLASADVMGWKGEHHGPKIGFIQHFVRGALENVGASTAQEDKIHDIIAATYTDLDQGKTGRDELRKQVLDLMRAPTIDRAAVEKLRTDQIAAFDATSKKIVAAALDAASQLTPEQRAKLVQQVEERMAQHRGGPMDEHGGPPRDRDRDHGPEEHGDHG